MDTVSTWLDNCWKFMGSIYAGNPDDSNEGKNLNSSENDILHTSTPIVDYVSSKTANPAIDFNNTAIIQGAAVFDNQKLILYLALCAGFTCVISILLTICFSRRNKNVRTNVQNVASQFLPDCNQDEKILENILRISFDKSLEIEKENFSIDESNILGWGVFGTVVTATVLYQNRITGAAVKTLRYTKNEVIGPLQSFVNEIKLLAYVGSHPNIVQLLGAYTAEVEVGQVYIFMELCHLGSVHSYLKRTSQGANVSEDPNYLSLYKSLRREPDDLFLKWSYEIASGMKHLAQKHVIHGDLATRNILLDKTFTAKICDFGLSRRIENYQTYVKAHNDPLPWRWMSYESLTKRQFSLRSDVWSYGVTLWEIFSNGCIPFQKYDWNRAFENMLLEGKRLEKPIGCHRQIYELMELCWKINPDDRPDFTEILIRVLSVPKSGSQAEAAESI